EWGTAGAYGGVYFNADLDLAGDGVYFNEQARTVDEPGALRHIGFDGSVLPSVDVAGGHTDFVQLADGTIGALSWDIRDVGGTRYLGDRLLEIDPDGTTREVWNVWDHYTP